MGGTGRIPTHFPGSLTNLSHTTPQHHNGLVSSRVLGVKQLPPVSVPLGGPLKDQLPPREPSFLTCFIPACFPDLAEISHPLMCPLPFSLLWRIYTILFLDWHFSGTPGEKGDRDMWLT